jgi:hypothetical protein
MILYTRQIDEVVTFWTFIREVLGLISSGIHTNVIVGFCVFPHFLDESTRKISQGHDRFLINLLIFIDQSLYHLTPCRLNTDSVVKQTTDVTMLRTSYPISWLEQ